MKLPSFQQNRYKLKDLSKSNSIHLCCIRAQMTITPCLVSFSYFFISCQIPYSHIDHIISTFTCATSLCHSSSQTSLLFHSLHPPRAVKLIKSASNLSHGADFWRFAHCCYPHASTDYSLGEQEISPWPTIFMCCSRSGLKLQGKSTPEVHLVTELQNRPSTKKTRYMPSLNL